MKQQQKRAIVLTICFVLLKIITTDSKHRYLLLLFDWYREQGLCALKSTEIHLIMQTRLKTFATSEPKWHLHTTQIHLKTYCQRKLTKKKKEIEFHVFPDLKFYQLKKNYI